MDQKERESSGESIDRAWHDAVLGLPFRAEDLEKPGQIFAQTAFIESLFANKSQVIFGRRGTGKTHLLLALKDRMRSDFDDSSIIPIYVNAQILRDSLLGTAESSEVRAMQLYAALLGCVTRELHSFIADEISPGFWSRVFGGKESDRANAARKAAQDLQDVLSFGEVVYLPAGSAKQEAQSVVQLDTEAKAGIGAKASTSLTDPGRIGLQLDAGYTLRSAESSSVKGAVEIEGKVVLPIQVVGRLLDDLLSSLDDARVVLLVDEWSAIDLQLSTQPYLLELLRRTLAASGRLKFKLACIPTRTRLSSTPDDADLPIGLEIGDDVGIDVNLDDVVFVQNDLRQILPFFIYLAKLHLGARSETITKTGTDEFARAVVSTVFESVDAFSELCQAAAAVPRDFLSLLRFSSEERSKTSHGPITIAHVRHAALRLEKDIENALGDDEVAVQAGRLFDELYRKYVAKNRSYFLLLSERTLDDPRMRRLWDRRLIHIMPHEQYDMSDDRTYRWIQMNYGRCVRRRMEEAKQQGRDKGLAWSTSLPDFSQRSWLGSLLHSAAESALPAIMARVEENRSLTDRAGKLEPVVVTDAEFSTLGFA